MPYQAVILAQLFPSAGIETQIYQVTATNRAWFQGITVSNHSGAQDALRISCTLTGVATTAKDYIYFDTPILGHDTLLAELDFVMNVSDVIRVVSANGTCSFTLYGVVI